MCLILKFKSHRIFHAIIPYFLHFPLPVQKAFELKYEFFFHLILVFSSKSNERLWLVGIFALCDAQLGFYDWLKFN